MNLTRPLLSFDFLFNQIQTRLEPEIIELKINPLAGDASNRSYYRLEILLKDRSQRSYVLMALAEPEPFKQSEEKESGKINLTELPFINIQRYLASHQIPVPTVFDFDEKNGLIILEDLGDFSLEKVIKKSSAAQVKNWYQKAIDELITFQLCTTTYEKCVAFERHYDRPLFLWEFDHFIEYGIGKGGEIKPKLEDLILFKESFGKVSTSLVAEPAVLVHRDYHSRNLMVHKERLRIIDFQDALLGPCQYDLASLLRDSYVKLSEDLIDELIDYYIDEREKTENKKQINRQQFRYIFDLISLQRNMKAAGRFIFIHLVKKNSNFLKYVPKALNDISINLNKYPEFKELKITLARYFPELSE